MSVCFFTERYVAAESLARAQLFQFDNFDTVRQLIEEAYISSKNNQHRLEYGAIRGYVAALNDPYTRFLTPDNYRDLKTKISGDLVGVGIKLGLKNGKHQVISVRAGSSADHKGVQAGDYLIRIGAEATEPMTLLEAAAQLQGRPGHRLVLTLTRTLNAAPYQVVVDCQSDVFPELSSPRLIGQTGYIHMSAMDTKNLGVSLQLALNQLSVQGMRALILDLRGNGGGLLQNAVDIAGLFLPADRVIVRILSRSSEEEPIYTPTQSPPYPTLPIAILIDKSTASSAEVLTAALQHYKRAIVLGEQSFGKATVQKVHQLPDGSALIYTVARYLTPDGRSIQDRGVVPDVRLSRVSSKDVLNPESSVWVKAAVERL